ncbi:MAG: hypothetical protein JWP69_184 [Flaviaesturariibacter sp.]|nr:hypothetical protein [Flaviaesturariibacter sp.]
MSSNSLHITRSNYEEYFLLYIDNELSGEDRRAVEAFAMLHPDLGEELDLLQGTTLETADISFLDKESLLADKMELSVIDESLLLYIDGELPAYQQKQVELELARNAAYKAQHDALLQTKLSPADAIVYPYKKELLRKEDSKRPLIWLRVAAAVIIVLGIGSFFLNGNKAANDTPVVANVLETKVPVITAVEPSVTLATEKEPAQTTNESGTGPVVAKTTSRKNTTPATTKHVRMNTLKVTDQQIAGITPPSHLDRIPEEVITARLQSRNTSVGEPSAQQTFNTGTVTPADVPSYTNHTAAKTEPSFASSMETKDDKEQGSVRGLLRKATRFIERRTGIKATDEDDRLLVGALAISLK